jgi:hypothetical protein
MNDIRENIYGNLISPCMPDVHFQYCTIVVYQKIKCVLETFNITGDYYINLMH